MWPRLELITVTVLLSLGLSSHKEETVWFTLFLKNAIALRNVQRKKLEPSIELEKARMFILELERKDGEEKEITLD